MVNGQPISSSLGVGVTQANRVAVSIWPIAFAALAAQALRMYASYKVERPSVNGAYPLDRDYEGRY